MGYHGERRRQRKVGWRGKRRRGRRRRHVCSPTDRRRDDLYIMSVRKRSRAPGTLAGSYVSSLAPPEDNCKVKGVSGSRCERRLAVTHPAEFRDGEFNVGGGERSEPAGTRTKQRGKSGHRRVCRESTLSYFVFVVRKHYFVQRYFKKNKSSKHQRGGDDFWGS